MKASEITDAMRLAMHRQPEPLVRFDPNRQPPVTSPQAPSSPASGRAITAHSKPVEAVLSPGTVESTSQPVLEAPDGKKSGGLAKPRGRKGMNKTEAAYALILESKKRAGEILRYEREGITLRWPDGMTYSADFAVWMNTGQQYPHEKQLLFIETKGAWIEQDALVKFRAARAHWPEFDFQMWQMKKGAWTRLL